MFTVPRSDVLVRCPRCDGLALVGDRRVTCTGCGYARVDTSLSPGWFCGCCLEWEGATPTLGVPVRMHRSLRCPQCGRKGTEAFDLPNPEARPPVAGACACGAVMVETGRDITSLLDPGMPVDRLLGLSLWLATPCVGHVLWAANASHLDYLGQVIGARIRPWPRRPHELSSRLPRWMTSATHRDAVVAGLGRLRGMLPADS